MLKVIWEEDKNIEIIFIFFVILIFAAVAALRNNIGDTYFYAHSYTLLKDFNGFSPDAKDKGFTIFSLILYDICEEIHNFLYL